LSSTFHRLSTAAAEPAGHLQAARTPSGQANGAQELAQAYQQAATQLSQGGVSPLVREANNGVVAAVRELAEGYSRAAGAAKSGDGAAYRRAVQEVSRGSAALSAASKVLAGAGYKVAS
jgi:hypothetical protein